MSKVGSNGMNNTIVICKAVSSIAISAAVAVTAYKTEQPVCLWALFFAAVLWG